MHITIYTLIVLLFVTLCNNLEEVDNFCKNKINLGTIATCLSLHITPVVMTTNELYMYNLTNKGKPVVKE